MTYRQAFVEGLARLKAAPHPTQSPELDARVLLTYAAGLNHAGLLARWDEALPVAAWGEWQSALERREAGEPVAWITGVKEFLGLDFLVPVGLLVPRADTETLVEAALECLGAAPAGGRPLRVVDVCTGTGCVAVGLAALAPVPLDTWAGDVSPLAVETARSNGKRLLSASRPLTVVESNLLQALPGPWDLIVSNPPYLTPGETEDRVGEGGWREPALALDGGGPDGLNLIRTLVEQATRELAPGAWFLLEAADAQMDAIAALLGGAGFQEVRWWKDLAGQRRVAGGRLAARR